MGNQCIQQKKDGESQREIITEKAHFSDQRIQTINSDLDLNKQNIYQNKSDKQITGSNVQSKQSDKERLTFFYQNSHFTTGSEINKKQEENFQNISFQKMDKNQQNYFLHNKQIF